MPFFNRANRIPSWGGKRAPRIFIQDTCGLWHVSVSTYSDSATTLCSPKHSIPMRVAIVEEHPDFQDWPRCEECEAKTEHPWGPLARLLEKTR